MSEDKPSVRKLLPARFKIASYATNRWNAVAEAGADYENDILKNPSYWVHITTLGKLRVSDIIELHNDEVSYYAELYVMAVDKQKGAVVHQLNFTKLEKAALAVGDHYIEHAGPHHKFRIVRIGDKHPVETGHATREEALASAARNNIKIVDKPASVAA